jgi:ABC-type multidrug transport system fused ATPase/permease subunit
MRIAGDKIVSALRNDIYEKAQYLPLNFYDKTSTGSVISRVSGDTATLQAFMLRISQEAVIQFFLMIGIIVIMFAMNWKLTLLSLTPVPFVVLGARFFGKRISPIYRKIWRRWAAVSSILSDTLPGIRVIKSFTGEQRAADKFEAYNNEWLREDRKAALLSNAFPSAVTFFVTCGSLLIWGMGGYWVIAMPDRISVGLLVSFISYTAMFYAPINFFATLSDTYQHALTSAERELDIIDAEPEQNFGEGNMINRIRGKIEFRNVSFSIDRIKKALTNINLVIEPGDIVGIVGTTGSGKSTLVNLLMRFYDNYEGDILVDDINIKDIDLSSFRSKIGYVQQEPMMFKDTIFRNIAYSSPDADVEQVIHAADVANAHSFIARMPDAYDTLLGERGVGLSGGERQRLSIARAVLKNPSLLIFDEATAAVDSETEHLIQQAIERLISGRTTLMIAHRLSTLRKANKIIVVDKGEIIEFGSHDELMAKQGKYFKLIEIQSLSEKIREGKEAENFE